MKVRRKYNKKGLISDSDNSHSLKKENTERNILDYNEQLLQNEKEKLEEELNILNLKNEEISLTYDNVKDNIKKLIKASIINDSNDTPFPNVDVSATEKKEDILQTTNQDLMTTHSQDNEITESTKNLNNISLSLSNDEDEIVKGYTNFLSTTKKNLDSVFLSVSYLYLCNS